MKNPFPGMDPYLEQFWLDVHARIILYACDQLEEQLPSNLLARVEERVVFECEGEEARAAYPDVKIAERRGMADSGVAVASRSAVCEPLFVRYPAAPATETFLHILHSGPNQRLVTVLEVLSLANKLSGEGQRQYRRKQRELADTNVSLVEIDLLRQGSRVLSVPTSWIPRHARTTYQVCVRRGWVHDIYEVYPAPLRSPLPTIRIPLREKDEDIRLDLQAIVDLAYRKGRYHLTLDYSEPPDPPLTDSDAKWAKTQLKKARKA
jgi:hypothetical protein